MLYKKCCTRNAVQENTVQEILYKKILYKKYCTRNAVQENTVHEMLYKKMLYMKCCTRKCCTRKCCTRNAVQENAVQEILYRKCCTKNAVRSHFGSSISGSKGHRTLKDNTILRTINSIKYLRKGLLHYAKSTKRTTRPENTQHTLQRNHERNQARLPLKVAVGAHHTLWRAGRAVNSPLAVASPRDT